MDNKIDLITHDPKKNEVVLIMVDDRPWDGSNDRMEELQERVNAYIGFALDGDMNRQFPQTVGLHFRLQLDTSIEPDNATKSFIDKLNQELTKFETHVDVNVRRIDV